MQARLSTQQKADLIEQLTGKTSESALYLLYLTGATYDSTTGEGFPRGIESLFPWASTITQGGIATELLKVSDISDSADGSLITILKKSIQERVNQNIIENEEEGRDAIAVLIKTLIGVIEREATIINEEFAKDIEAIISARKVAEDTTLHISLSLDKVNESTAIEDKLKQKAIDPLIQQLPAKYEQALIQAKLLSAPTAKDNKHSPAPSSKSAEATTTASSNKGNAGSSTKGGDDKSQYKAELAAPNTTSSASKKSEDASKHSSLSKEQAALQEKLIGNTTQSVLYKHSQVDTYDSKTGEGFKNYAISKDSRVNWIPYNCAGDLMDQLQVGNPESNVSRSDGPIVEVLKRSIEYQISKEIINNETKGQKALTQLINKFIDMFHDELATLLGKHSSFAELKELDAKRRRGVKLTPADLDTFDRLNIAVEKILTPIINELPKKYEQALIREKLLSASLANENKHDPAPASTSAAASPAAKGADPKAQQKQQPANTAKTETAVAAKIDHKLIGFKQSDTREKEESKIRADHKEIKGYDASNNADIDKKFIALTKAEKPIDATYLSEVKSQLDLVWKANCVSVMKKYDRNPKQYAPHLAQLDKDFHQLSNLVAEALTIRVSYNKKKGFSKNKDAMPFMGADVNTGEFPDLKDAKIDRNVNYIKEIEWKVLNCLLDSSRTPIEAYNDLLQTLNSVSARAHGEFIRAGGSTAGSFYRIFRTTVGFGSDLTSVIEASIKANQFQLIPTADAPQPKYKS